MTSVETDASRSWVKATGMSFHEILAAAATEYDNLKGRATDLTKENHLLKEKLKVASIAHAKTAPEEGRASLFPPPESSLQLPDEEDQEQNSPLSPCGESGGSARAKTWCNMMRRVPAASSPCESARAAVEASERDAAGTPALPLPFTSAGSSLRHPIGDSGRSPALAGDMGADPATRTSMGSTTQQFSGGASNSLSTAVKESSQPSIDIDDSFCLSTGPDEQPTWPTVKLSVLGKRPQPASKPSRRSARLANGIAPVATAGDSQPALTSPHTLGEKVLPASSSHQVAAAPAILEHPAADATAESLLAEVALERAAATTTDRDEEAENADSKGKVEGRILRLHARGKLGAGGPAGSMVGLPCSYGAPAVGGAPSGIRGFLPRALAVGQSSNACSEALKSKSSDDWMDWDGPAEVDDGDGASGGAGERRPSRHGATAERSESWEAPAPTEMPSYKTPRSPELPPSPPLEGRGNELNLKMQEHLPAHAMNVLVALSQIPLAAGPAEAGPEMPLRSVDSRTHL